MHTRVFRVSILALTVALLALPFVATAQQPDEQFSDHRIMFTEDEPSGRSEPMARYQIYAEREMDLAKAIRFVEINGWSYDTNFTIEIVYAVRTEPSHAYDRDFPLSPDQGF